MKRLIIRPISISEYSPSDEFPNYTCHVCSKKMKYEDIIVVGDIGHRTLYIATCSLLCAEMAVIQNI